MRGCKNCVFRQENGIFNSIPFLLEKMTEHDELFGKVRSLNKANMEYMRKLEAKVLELEVATKEKDVYIKQYELRILLLEGRLKTPNVPVIEQKKQQYEKRVLLLEERMNGHIPLVSLEEKKRIMAEYYFKEVPCKQVHDHKLTKIKHALPWFDK